MEKRGGVFPDLKRPLVIGEGEVGGIIGSGNPLILRKGKKRRFPRAIPF